MQPHHYEPPVAYHYHNTPCKACGKTARHAVHQVGAAPAAKAYVGKRRASARVQKAYEQIAREWN